MELPRWVLLSALDDALRAAEQSADNKAAGMGDLFGDVVPAATGGDPYKDHRRARAWTLRDVLAGEKESLVAFLAVTPWMSSEPKSANLRRALFVN